MRANNSFREKIVEGDLSKGILSLAVPMVVANAANNVFSLTDMYFVGKLGSMAVAAVGMAAIVNMATITLLVGIATATRAMISRYIGANDFDAAHRSAVGSIFFGALISITIAIFGVAFAKIVLILMGAKGELLTASTNYLIIMMLGSFTAVFVFIMNAIFQGAGDSKTPMIITISAVALNIVLDPMFIFGIGFFPKWGINGAAFATVLSRFIAALTGFFLLVRGVNAFKIHLSHFKTDIPTLKRFLHIGVPGGGQVLLGNFMGFIMMRIATSFGIYATAAYTIGIRLNMMALLPGYALGNAIATIVGQNLGAGKIERAKNGAIIGVKFYEILVIPLGILYYLLAPNIVRLFTNDGATILLGAKYLRIVPFSYPFFAIGAILMRAINGAGHTRPAFVVQFVAMYLIQFPLALVLTKTFGAIGIWWAIFAGMTTQGIIILPYFLSMKWATVGKWKEKSSGGV